MNGFDDFDTQVNVEEVYQEDEMSYDWEEETQGYEYDDSQWDDDPNPYHGTYSED
jgi:hypothetical protein